MAGGYVVQGGGDFEVAGTTFAYSTIFQFSLFCKKSYASIPYNDLKRNC